MSIKKYQPSQIEKKWQERWKENQLYASNLSGKNNYYVLAEFPYPSGDLHMGHWFTWGGADVFARFKRMQGLKVFFPCGFDAFGLPAENAAIKRNIHPQDWTMDNIARMKDQFSTMGASFTFDNQVITCLPEYYRWNQWIFLKMLEKGIAYRDKFLSNWCPVDQTVLANEGVLDGKCWRCGAEVVQKYVDQWFFKITDYADNLLWPEPGTDGLSNGVDWPQSVREGQNTWIGRSEGVLLTFKVDGSDLEFEVFTTAIDTVFGVSFVVLSPEHPLVGKVATADQKEAVKAYAEAAKKKPEIERKENKQKTGVPTGSFVINPLNNQKVPLWVADYVLSSYGTGAVMGVPAHDFRDYEFAKKFALPIKPVVRPKNTAKKPKVLKDGFWDYPEIKGPFCEQSELFDSGEYSGLTAKQAKEKLSADIEAKRIGKREVQYHLHDWSVSRQRYWGTPIPVIHCPRCGIVPVPEEDLPVELPYNVDYAPHGKSPLASNEEWLKVKCPKCHDQAERDADTMDTFVDSSWYFFRYLSPHLETGAFDQEVAARLMPVDIYFGGAEHTLGHTLYSRFFTKFFKDLELTNLEEYAKQRVNHGIVLGPDGNKMSKSKGNVVNPDDEVRKFGADAVRVYLAFFMPYEGTGPWVSERIWGAYRFLERVWGLQDKVKTDIEVDTESLFYMHKTIKKVTNDLEQIKFNTAVAALMEWINYLSKKDLVSELEFKVFLQLLAPIAPHLTEELWETLVGQNQSIHASLWPKAEQAYLMTAVAKVAVQINGKVRGVVDVSQVDLENQDKIKELALQNPNIQKFIGGKEIKKIISVPGKVLSLVV